MEEGETEMNKTKIEWTDYSWNPIVGCKHGCWYCYARKLTQRFKKIFPNGFEPTFYPERLKEPWQLKKQSKIFVCSIADLFAPWTPYSWQTEVIKSVEMCPIKHIFQLLTKNPERINRYHVFPENVWIGATVNTAEDFWRIREIACVQSKIRFISFEPLLGDMEDVELGGINWVIIGKLTGSKKVKLDMKWVMDVSAECSRQKIPVFLKNNLGLKNPRQEFPAILGEE
jgi:protein gp37